MLVAQLPNIDQAHSWLLDACDDCPAVELIVLYDERHTQSADRYAADRAADCAANESRREWAAALKAAGVQSMGFAVAVARFNSAAAGGAARRTGSRVRVRVPGGTRATATMLSAGGLRQLRRVTRAALEGLEPLTAEIAEEPAQISRGAFGAFARRCRGAAAGAHPSRSGAPV